MSAPETWTLASLKEHFEALRETDKEAIRVALSSYEKRMDTTNEWRQALNDQQATFVTKGQVAWAITAFFLGIGAATAIFAALSRGG